MLKAISLTVLLSAWIVSVGAQHIYKRNMLLMGCHFDITVVANDSIQADSYIDLASDEISRIEHLISTWIPSSQVSEINRNAGIRPIKVDQELYDLTARALGFSQLTDGAFDISYASMDKVWKFDGSMQVMPSEESIRSSVSKVGYQNILLDPKQGTVFLKLEGMKIDFGAIGKGYAAEKAKALLLTHGVTSGIINASGDMSVWGKQPDGSAWKVAITNPFDKSKAFALMPVHDGAVATSGNYEKYVTLQGKRYSHIIDPRTGYPTQGIVSVTIFAPNAELADALATSVFVLGKDVGLSRISQIPDVECIVIDEAGNIFTSEHIAIEKL